MSWARLRVLALGALLLLLAGTSACGDQKNIQLLEAKKSEILDHTTPKQEFWDEVGRKGDALKKERGAAEDLASVSAKSAQAKASLDSLRKQVEEARSTNAKASEVLAQQVAQLEKSEAEVAEKEAVLAAFRERQQSGETP